MTDRKTEKPKYYSSHRSRQSSKKKLYGCLPNNIANTLINGKKNILPERARVQYDFNAYNNKGISSRKLLKLGIGDFYRKFKIDNINQISYNEILPYLVGTSGNTRENFVVITKKNGLPMKLINKLNLKISELLKVEKKLTMFKDSICLK